MPVIVRAKRQTREPNAAMTASSDRLSLRGKVAIVTGGARGIGRAAAQAFASAGAIVVVADIDRDAASATAAALGGVAESFDVADETQVKVAIAAIAQRHGRIDILVNNAGTGARMPTEDLALADWNRVLAINLTGAFLCSREAGRHMLAQGSGAIVNVASIMGLVGNALYPNLAYHATKGALVNMTRALAVEWAARGVRVNAVAPTFAKTDLTQKLLADAEMERAIVDLTPMHRLAEPHEVADAILYLCSDMASMVTGQILAVDGGWVAR
jgi:NAD(P)-dependent dehydrogenase (short-subunit alcohol dehydrogenase family)